MNRTENGITILTAGTGVNDLDKRFYYRAYQDVVYKQTPQGDLEMSIHYPYDWKEGDQRPGILFFFGGGFSVGNRYQYARLCAYLASRGMVAATADYRVTTKHGTGLYECFEDGFSAMRWFRGHADELGLDPERIAAGGGSAGGAVASALATLTGFDAPGEDATVSALPNAMVLYNPAFLVAFRNDPDRDAEAKASWLEMLGALQVTEDEAHRYVILDHLHGNLPPTYLWFGTDDRLLTPGRDFIERATSLGVPVDVQIVEGANHGQWNDFEPMFLDSVRRIDAFLVAHGFLDNA